MCKIKLECKSACKNVCMLVCTYVFNATYEVYYEKSLPLCSGMQCGIQLVEKCNIGITGYKCIYVYILFCICTYICDEDLTHTFTRTAMHESDFLRATFAVHYIRVLTFRLPLQSP